MAVTVPHQWTNVGADVDTEVITAPTSGNWLVAILACRTVDGTTPLLNVGDPSRNMWTLLASTTDGPANSTNTAAGLQVEVWACPSAAYDGWPWLPVYAAAMAISASDVGSLLVDVFEVAGMANGQLTCDSVRVATASASQTLTLTAPNPSSGADCLMVAAAVADIAYGSYTTTGAGWTQLSNVVRGGPNAGLFGAWREATTGGSVTFSLSAGFSQNWAGVVASFRTTGVLPSQPNPNWPISRLLVGLGYQLGTPLSRVAWTDQTSRLVDQPGQSVLHAPRGIPYDQGIAQSEPSSLTIRNDDGAYTPRPAATATASAAGSTTTIRVPQAAVTAAGAVVNPNPDFGSNVTGWSPQGSTLAWSTAVVNTGQGATGSLQITPDGVSSSGGAIDALSGLGSVVPGASYTASMWANSTNGWSDIRVAVDWYDGTGTMLSTSFGTQHALPAGVWTFMSDTFTAPTGATQAMMRARHGGTPPASAVWYVWACRLTLMTALTTPRKGDFFQLKYASTAAPAPVFSDDFESGGLTNWPTVTGAASASTAAAYAGTYGARINPGGGLAAQLATTTSKWTQSTYTWTLIRAKFRFNTLPTIGTSADIFTMQVAPTQTDNFDCFINATTGTLHFDLKGAVAFVDTGITPVIGHWYDFQARVYYGSSTYTAEVYLDGIYYGVLSSPGETSGFVRSFFIGTSSTSKTYQFDVDNVSIVVATSPPPLGAANALKEQTVFQVTGTPTSSGGITTVPFARADGAGGALAAASIGDQYAGIPVDLYIPWRYVAYWGGRWYPVSTGWLGELPQSWTDAHWGEVHATGIDALATLTAGNMSPLRGEILRRSPTHYWPCDDPQGTGYAANASGQSNVALNSVQSKFGAGANGAADFGASTQAIDSGQGYKMGVAGDPGTAWQQQGLTQAEGAANKGFALVGRGDDFPSVTTGVTIVGTLLGTDINTGTQSYNETVIIVRNSDPAQGGAGSLIKLFIPHPALNCSITVWDKTTHATTTTAGPGGTALGLPTSAGEVWAIAFNQTSWTAWVDGQSWSGTCNLPPKFTLFDVGGEADEFFNGNCFNGIHNHIAIYPRMLTAGEINAITYASRDALPPGPANETTSQRVQRKLNTVAWRGGRVITPTTVLMDAEDTQDSSTIAQTASTITGTEDGAIFVDGLGQLQLRSRNYSYYQRPKAVLGDGPGEIPYDVSNIFGYDSTYLYNDVEIANTKYIGFCTWSTANLVAIDDTSAGQYGERSLSRGTRAYYPGDAWHLGWWLLAKSAYPQLRAATVQVNVAANPAAWATVLGLEVGDLVTVNRRPIGSPTTISERCRILQVEPDIGPGRAVFTLTLTWGFKPVAIAGDTAYGPLGSTVLGA